MLKIHQAFGRATAVPQRKHAAVWSIMEAKTNALKEVASLELTKRERFMTVLTE
jgi:hypothetical protein